MESFEFSLKVVSPAFVGGTMEQDSDPPMQHRGKIVKHRQIGPDKDGLRVPSLRGVLRFWFRCMHAQLSMPDLYKKEAKIFGDIQAGQGVRLIPRGHSNWEKGIEVLPAFKVTKHTLDTMKSEGVDDEVLEKLAPLRDKMIEGQADFLDKVKQAIGTDLNSQDQKRLLNYSDITRYAVGYLGYGPVNNERTGATSHNRNLWRDAIPPSAVFNFKAIGSAEQLLEVKRCLKLMHLFGGIGARSRRGWGSLSVEIDRERFPREPEQGEEVDAWFRRALFSIWPDSENPFALTNEPQYSAFWRDTRICISEDSWPADESRNYHYVLKAFYDRFKTVRLWDMKTPSASPAIAKADYQIEKRAYTSKPDLHDIPRRLAYGMPYHPKLRGRQSSLKYMGKNPDIDRRASPLLLKVFRHPSNRLYAVCLFLKAQFFRDPAIEITIPKYSNSVPFPLWEAIEGSASAEGYLGGSTWNEIDLTV